MLKDDSQGPGLTWAELSKLRLSLGLENGLFLPSISNREALRPASSHMNQTFNFTIKTWLKSTVGRKLDKIRLQSPVKSKEAKGIKSGRTQKLLPDFPVNRQPWCPS